MGFAGRTQGPFRWSKRRPVPCKRAPPGKWEHPLGLRRNHRVYVGDSDDPGAYCDCKSGKQARCSQKVASCASSTRTRTLELRLMGQGRTARACGFRNWNWHQCPRLGHRMRRSYVVLSTEARPEPVQGGRGLRPDRSGDFRPYRAKGTDPLIRPRRWSIRSRRSIAVEDAPSQEPRGLGV